MNLATYAFSLDINKTGSQVMIETKRNYTGRKLLISLTENGRPYEITSDCTAVFRARKPDGTVLFNDCDIIDNVIQYTFTTQTLASVGLLECEVTLYGGDNAQIISPNFSIMVDDTVQDDNEVESSNEFTALTQAMAAYASARRIGYVNLLAANWEGDASPYSQVVSVAGATKYSQVDLTPDAEQLSIFHNKDLAFVTENESGVITVYAIGQKPTNDYTIQATITEVNV